MRKYALITASLLLAVQAFAQNIYIRYDVSCMDKYEYRFVENANSVAYNSYRMPNAMGDYLFFETGLETPVIRKKVTDNMIDCRNMTLDRSQLEAINTGKIKIYICKKLDSGWAIMPVGSASFMALHENTMTYKSPNYELQAGLGAFTGDNVAMHYADKEAQAAMFYLGDIPACDSKAYMFRVSPCHICRIEADVTMHPQLGLIREKEINGETFELVSINDIPVCEFLSPTPTAVTSSESQPEYVMQEQINSEAPQTSSAEMNYSTADATSGSETIRSKTVEEPFQKPCGIYAMEGEHVVAEGESLYGVARRYGITVNNLRSWNDMTTDVIYPCTLIKIVAPPRAEQPSMTVAHTNDVPMNYDKKVVKKNIDCNTQAGENEYVVQQGESLFAIAKKNNLKVDQLRSWNNLASDIIHPCDKLSLVEPVQEAVVETKSVKKVVKKPTAIPKTYAIVVKPKTTKPVAKPKAVAPKKAELKTRSITVVKPKKATIVTAKSVETTEIEPALTVKQGVGLHVVKQGETVATLADRFDLSYNEFRKINNLSSNERIFVGQVVKTQNCACSVEEELPKIYNTVVVKKGSSVPKSYNEVEMPKPIKIKAQEVTSKDGEDKRRKYHVVQGNETLFSIARMYGTTVNKLRNANHLDENETITTEQLLILDK